MDADFLLQWLDLGKELHKSLESQPSYAQDLVRGRIKTNSGTLEDLAHLFTNRASQYEHLKTRERDKYEHFSQVKSKCLICGKAINYN
ncbi:hypothetical protein BGZ65_011280, partial [Modicella reniformis]